LELTFVALDEVGIDFDSGETVKEDRPRFQRGRAGLEIDAWQIVNPTSRSLQSSGHRQIDCMK